MESFFKKLARLMMSVPNLLRIWSTAFSISFIFLDCSDSNRLIWLNSSSDIFVARTPIKRSGVRSQNSFSRRQAFS